MIIKIFANIYIHMQFLTETFWDVFKQFDFLFIDRGNVKAKKQ